jgi:hypothetical protein
LSFEESVGAASACGATAVQIGARRRRPRAVTLALTDLGLTVLVIDDRDAVRANALMPTCKRATIRRSGVCDVAGISGVISQVLDRCEAL